MSDDLIKRSDAIKALHKHFSSGFDCDRWWNSTTVIFALNSVPSADRPQGKWKRRLVDNGFNADWVCSECGYRVKTDFVSFNFCPNCGCRMKGADDE